MPDPHDEPELAGSRTGSTQVSEQRGSHSNDEASPTPAHRGSKASDTDPPKKKRKVNHGKTSLSNSPGFDS